MNIIKTKNLCKQYGGAMRVNHVDLSVPEACVYGFLGPNGAGKSTTLKMLLGLVRPTAGDIWVLNPTGCKNARHLVYSFYQFNGNGVAA